MKPETVIPSLLLVGIYDAVHLSSLTQYLTRQLISKK